MRFFSSACVAVLIAVPFFVSPSVVQAATKDWTAVDLGKARRDYEQNLESLRGVISKGITAKISAAKDADALKQARAEQSDFELEGKLPDTKTVDGWRKRYAQLAFKMSNAYLTAEKAYAKAGNKPLADDAADDADHFGSHWDLGPWQVLVGKGENVLPPQTITWTAPLIVKLGLTDKHLVNQEDAQAGSPAVGGTRSSDDPSQVPGSPQGGAVASVGEYRLEVLGKRVGKAGNLTIRFPLASGEELSVPANAADHGEIDVLISVFKNHISADLGTDRPIDMTKQLDGPGDSVTLKTDGSFAIECVKVKPIVEGAPPQVRQVVAAQLAAQAVPPGCAQLFPVGSKWSGKMVNNVAGPKTESATVLKAEGNNLVMRLNNGSTTADWDFSVDGNNLSLNQVRVITGGAGQVKNVRISGTVNNDQLIVSGTCVWQGGGGGHGQTVTLTLSRD